MLPLAEMATSIVVRSTMAERVSCADCPVGRARQMITLTMAAMAIAPKMM